MLNRRDLEKGPGPRGAVPAASGAEPASSGAGGSTAPAGGRYARAGYIVLLAAREEHSFRRQWFPFLLIFVGPV